MKRIGSPKRIILIVIIMSITLIFLRSEGMDDKSGELLVQDQNEPHTYTVKNGISWIPDEACSGMMELEVLIIPEGVTWIGSSAFFGCRNLKKVIFPETLLIIDTSAFQQCFQLSEIILPSNLYALGSLCFAETALQEIIIPKSVSLIGEEAFVWTPIHTIDIRSHYMEFISDILFDIDNDVQIYIPSAEYYYAEKLISKYKNYENIRFTIHPEE